MHTLIIGQTMRGKTTLARAIVRQLPKKRKALILDPLNGKWDNHKLHDNVEDLIKNAKESNDCLLVVDEASISLNAYDRSQHWLAKTSRHFGHAAIFIGQSYTDVARGIRDQCSRIFIFGCSRTTARILADEFDDDRILRATTLPKLHFCMIDMGAEGKARVKFGKVDYDSLKIFMEKT